MRGAVYHGLTAQGTEGRRPPGRGRVSGEGCSLAGGGGQETEQCSTQRDVSADILEPWPQPAQGEAALHSAGTFLL